MSEGNGYATKDALFAEPFQRRYIDRIEAFNGKEFKFRLQNLNDREKGEYDAAAVNSKGKFNRYSVKTANARLVQLCSVEPKFSANDIEKLRDLDSAGIERLAAACREHCGWDEEPEKNSDTTEDGDSPTSSRSPSVSTT